MSANIEHQLSKPLQIEREFLMSKLRVPAAKLAKFQEQVRKTLPSFETEKGSLEQGQPRTLRWRLAISGVAKRPDQKLEVVHIWKTPKVWSLYTAMQFLASNRDYAELHDCVEHEAQHVMGTENMYSPQNLAPIVAEKLVLESFASPSDRGAVARLQFGMSRLARKLHDEHGWRLLLALQHETGSLGTRVHVWGIEPKPDGPPASELIVSGQAALLGSDIYQSTTLLKERSTKRVEDCRVAPRFDVYDPVHY